MHAPFQSLKKLANRQGEEASLHFQQQHSIKPKTKGKKALAYF
jgi:hypothetical protein